MSMNFYLSIISRHLISTVAINDVILFQDKTSEGGTLIIPATVWLKSGDNEISATLQWPPNISFQPGLAKIDVVVFLPDPSAQAVKPGTVVARLQWPQPHIAEAYPRVSKQRFKINQPLPIHLWKDASPLSELQNSDRSEMFRQVQALQTAAEKNDVDTAIQLQRYSYEEDARAEMIPLEKLLMVVYGQWNRLESHPNRGRSLKPGNLSYRIVGGGQLVHVTYGASEPSISIEIGDGEDAMRLSIHTWFARIAGNWVVARRI